MQKLTSLKHGGATKKGPLPITRLISKDHTAYPILYNEFGIRRTDEEINEIVSELQAKAGKNEQN